MDLQIYVQVSENRFRRLCGLQTALLPFRLCRILMMLI